MIAEVDTIQKEYHESRKVERPGEPNNQISPPLHPLDSPEWVQQTEQLTDVQATDHGYCSQRAPITNMIQSETQDFTGG